MQLNRKYRLHNCGELSEAQVGKPTRLSGWVNRIRDHGGLVFVEIRDHFGITQCVLDMTSPTFEQISKLNNEDVITIEGTVTLRPEGTANPKLKTGNIEVAITNCIVISKAKELPIPVFPVFDATGNQVEYPEELKLKYRFLDLRTEKLHKNISLRSQVISFLRQKMTEAGSLEIQTPILTASSPEGARDFLVPSRLHPGEFYALPQAPQQFKQLLMVSGFNMYHQIAPCFRDEAGRSDRSPGEFYQLDLEMSFVEQDDVFRLMEEVIGETFEKFGGDKKLTKATWKLAGSDKTRSSFTWPRIPYETAMINYGTDKPDLRVDGHFYIQPITDIFIKNGAPPFLQEILDAHGIIRCIPMYHDDKAPVTGKFYKDLDSYAKDLGMPGLGYFKTDSLCENLSGPLGKFINKKIAQEIMATFKHVAASPAAYSYFIVAGQRKDVERWSSVLRVEIAKRAGHYDENRFKFCWITDFPMFEYNEEAKKIDFSHNPFSMPQGGMAALQEKDPLTIKAYQYDLVCNGLELSSGGVRNHEPETLIKAFEIAGYSRAEVEEKFAGMLTAFRYGVPPHAGIAPGVERILMLLTGASNIREVIAFPMNQQGRDLLMNAPAPVTPAQLKELNIRIPIKNS
jgi:aspartyl-tRNA synthetase